MSFENCSPRDSLTSTKPSTCTIASSGQKIKLSSLLKITSAVSAHDLEIGEGAVDITVGFTDVPQPIRDRKIVDSNNEIMVRGIFILITSITITGYGKSFCKYFDIKCSSLSLEIIFGSFFLGCLALLINFFYPINTLTCKFIQFLTICFNL